MKECSLQQWPGSDDRAVVYDMLDNADSPHWAACREYVNRCVTKLVFKWRCSPALREDVVQDSMLSVMKSLCDFQFQCRLTTWLMMIVDRRMADVMRSEKRRLAKEADSLDTTNLYGERDNERDVPSIHTVEEECLVREELRCVTAYLQEYLAYHSKPERNKQLLNLVLFRGFSVSEAAALLGVPSPTASYIVRNARRYVR